jgi:primosomal protein N' (replication factor Y)
MSALKIALVAVDGAAYHYDRPYSYRIPDEMIGVALPGARVTVPFGNGNKRCRGIIVSTGDGDDTHCKPLLSVVDKEPLIGESMISLAFWIKEHTFCTLYEALRLMLPAGLNLRITKIYTVCRDMPQETYAMLSEDARCMVDFLLRSRAPTTREKLTQAVGLDEKSPLPDLLVQQGLFFCEDSVLDQSSEATARMVRLAVNDEEAQGLLERQGELTKKQKSALKTLLDAGTATVREVMYFSGVSASVVSALVKKCIFEQYEKRVYRDPYKNLTKADKQPDVLSPLQQKSYEELFAQYKTKKATASLLLGVTGSGKTQVFMRLIDDVRADGRSVIVLVPEISLTPQAVSRFYARFGNDVAVLHSGLSLGERLDEWQRIKNGGAGIVVGTRSAIFAPVEDLGLIIIDEEQEYTYKSESSPRYHARDVARFRCAKADAMLLLASATPSVDSFYAANSGKYHLTRLETRYGDAQLPEVVMVDMKQELLSGNTGPISERLAQELDENLKSGRQSILLINRRGYNTFVSCAQCGHVLTCPNCSIALTYHSANGRLMCHYCGYSTEQQTKCPECSGNFMRYSGTGTQKAEEAVLELFPRARTLRMDMDTTSGRYSHEKILEKFGSGRYDILIGTQMVAKGLDFPGVTLVGVLSADQSLYMDDFRASERTFSLLTQVVGRSGRSVYPGRAVIQTQTPENDVLRLAALQDYNDFYASEISLRRELLYPPFCDICEIGFTGVEENAVRGAAADFFERLKTAVFASSGIPVRIMLPSAACVVKISGRYRYRIIIKCRNNQKFRAIISELLRGCGKSKIYRKIAVFADMNPLDIM